MKSCKFIVLFLLLSSGMSQVSFGMTPEEQESPVAISEVAAEQAPVQAPILAKEQVDEEITEDEVMPEEGTEEIVDEESEGMLE